MEIKSDELLIAIKHGKKGITYCAETLLGAEFYQPDCGLITARGIRYYKKSVLPLEFRVHSEKQYLEIGAGMGEFILWLVNNHELKHKPIVIDPFDYQIFGCMIETALEHVKFNPKQLQDHLQRIRTVLDPEKVKLYNTTLQEAMDSHSSELKHCADVVVDFNGVTLWGTREERELEKLLLRDKNSQFYQVNIQD